MTPKTQSCFCCAAIFFIFSLFFDESFAVTLTAGQTDYSTTSDITTSSHGITSSLSGSSSSLNKIKNTYTITTGNSGITSGAYGIRTTGGYNQITNDTSATIITTGSSGRGISVASNSNVYNLGSIITQGTTSYGIYAGSGNNTINNSGSISTSNTTSYGIYLSNNNNSVINSGSINTKVYGIYSDGNSNQISNSGTVTTTISSSAHGIFVSAGSSSTATAINHITINNSGIINSSGNGIYNKDNYSEVSNSGEISATFASSIYGIRNEGNYVTIDNSGTISATNYAIYNSGEELIINNLGTLNGGVELNSGTLNILGGTISGVVSSETNSGLVVVGSNSSGSVNFDQTADFSNLASLTISTASTLNSSAAIEATNIYLESGSTLNLNNSSAVSGFIQGQSDASGILNINNSSLSILQAIGSETNSLANLNINSGAILNIAGDIYADEISLFGTLNFNQADNLVIAGNVSGSGSGTINIGSKNQTVNGDFSLNSGDELSISLKNGGVGNLSVSGAINIDSAAKISIATSSDQGYIADGTKYNIISSNNLSSSSSSIAEISDANITVNGIDSNIYGLLEFSVSTTSSGLALDINHLTASQVTTNQNAQNIYQNLLNIGSSSSGKLLEFQEYLDSSGLQGDQVTALINQLAPQSAKAEIATTNNVVSNFINIAENRLEKKRQENQLNSLPESFWAQIFGGSARQEAIKSDTGYNNSFAGMAFGFDREISDDSVLGSAFAWSKAAIKTFDSTKQNLIDTYQINFYGSRNFDKLFFDGSVALALNRFDSNRAINAVSSNALARYFGQTYGLKLKTSYVQNLKNNLDLLPEISLNFLQNNVTNYSEEDAEELNLRVGAIKANFLELRSGVNLRFSQKINEYPEFRKATVLLKLSYGYAFINDVPNVVVSFQNQTTSFNSQTTHLDHGSLKLGAEVAAFHKDNSIFSLDYNFEKKATYSSHMAIFKVRQEF